MTQKKWSTETCPNGMQYDENNNICFKEIEVEFAAPIARYELVGKTNDNIYQFIGYKVMECPN